MTAQVGAAAAPVAEAVPRRRGLGFWALTSLVVGNVIGSSIFLLPALLAPFGGLAIVSWLITSAGSILLALVFAKLAAIVPRAGGPYAYTRLAFGDFTGFIIAWGYWIGLWGSVAAVAVGTLSYVGALFPAVATSMALSGIVAIGGILILTFVNLRGVGAAGTFQAVTTVLKLVPLVAIGTLGLLHANLAHFAPTIPEGYPNLVSAIIGATAITLFSFLGIESATVPADDVDDPTRTIPRATVVGTVVVAAVYVLSTIGVLGALPPSVLAVSPAPYADAAAAMWGEWAWLLVTIGAIISGFGALNGFILLQGQVPLAAAQDGLFPARFARLSQAGVPAFGCIVSTALAATVLGAHFFGREATGGLMDAYNGIILVATFTTVVPYAFCAMAELLLAIPRRGEVNPGRLGLTTLIGSLAFAFAFIAIAGAGADTALKGFLALLAGVPVYVWLKRQSAARPIE
jgi:APA family basic amino acid/polyamine antiporter